MSQPVETETTPFGPLGWFVWKRTYAREGETTFAQTIDRCLDACETQLHCGFTADERAEFRHLLLQLKGMMAGRFLWQLGTSTVDRLGLLSLQNCAAMSIDSPVTCYTWLFDALMLGVGVGFNIEDKTVCNIEKVRYCEIEHLHCDFYNDENYIGFADENGDSSDASGSEYYMKSGKGGNYKDPVFVVPDSREGWVRLLKLLLCEHFPIDGKRQLLGIPAGGLFRYNTIMVRAKGLPIKGFGGVSSGHETLVWGLGEINRILNSVSGQRPSPVVLLDIANLIGHIVVSGNVRRSAQIAVGSADNTAFLDAKRWDSDEVPPYWRSNSNNSVAAYNIKALPETFWDLYGGGSEPYGLINLPLCRSSGQVGSETAMPKTDADVIGVNPCAEQPLCNFETCCLAEVFLPNCTSEHEMRRIVYFLYRVCKHSLRLPCHWPQTDAIVKKNMRMGIGQSGILQASDEQRSWLPTCAAYLDQLDADYSAAHGWPRSIKLRTVKPSGTLSLLAGVTAGCHPAPFSYYLKRMRVSREWADEARTRGYHVEPVEYVVQDEDTGQPLDRYDERTYVVDFPVTHGPAVRLASSMSAIAQIKVMQHLQEVWSDNAVSMTVVYWPHELPEIRRYLEQEYKTGIKAISFLLRQDHNFRQAPWTEVTAVEYAHRVFAIKRPFGGVDSDEHQSRAAAFPVLGDDELNENAECQGGACPRR